MAALTRPQYEHLDRILARGRFRRDSRWPRVLRRVVTVPAGRAEYVEADVVARK